MNDASSLAPGGIIEVAPDSPAYGGASIGRVGGKVVMVRGAIPGETVSARITEDRRDYLKADAVEILSPSPLRVTPGCPYYYDCGGCDFQHISPEGQVSLKSDVLSYTLRRIGKIDVVPDASITGNAWAYRYRAQFKCSGGDIGFYREGTRDIVDIESCPIMAPGINEALGRIRDIAGLPDVSELHISLGGKPVGMVIPAKGSAGPSDALITILLEAGLAGVTVMPKKGRPKVYGEKRFALDLHDLRYEVSAPSFFQSNWEVNLKLAGLIKERLGKEERRGRVLDLYSGAGNFSLPLSAIFDEITGVEENPHAVSDAKHNTAINGITNCRYLRSDAGSFRPPGDIDVLVTDPPRPGLTKAALKKVIDMRPGLIVYVSCNPSTFARDLNRFVKAGYDLESVRMVDFFPQTHHIESVGFLRLTT